MGLWANKILFHSLVKDLSLKMPFMNFIVALQSIMVSLLDAIALEEKMVLVGVLSGEISVSIWCASYLLEKNRFWHFSNTNLFPVLNWIRVFHFFGTVLIWLLKFVLH